MMSCPRCGQEVQEDYVFCKYCGTRLADVASSQAVVEDPAEAEVRSILVKRFDGIKNKDEASVRAVVDQGYSKFDDWAPLTRQESEEALKSEFGAFKVLSNYNYELKDVKVNIFGDAAVATYYIQYQGVIRDRPFNVSSRVTTVLKRGDSGWRILHEHLSRLPDQGQGGQQGQRRRGFPF
jgi:hypothetical protein